MRGRNTILRRILLETLWKHGAMNKSEIYQRIMDENRLLKIPTEHSISSLLHKSCQVVEVGKVVVETESGNRATHTLFDINRDIIKSERELVMSMPDKLLTAEESHDVIRCLECARKRKDYLDGRCLFCVKSSSL